MTSFNHYAMERWAHSFIDMCSGYCQSAMVTGESLYAPRRATK